MSNFSPSLKSFITSLVVWLTNAIGGSLILGLLMLLKATDETGDNAQMMVAGSGFVFIFSLLIASIFLILNIPATILSFFITRKLPRTFEESSRRFFVLAFSALLTPLFLMALPVFIKTLLEDFGHLSLFVGSELLTAFICFVLLKRIGHILFLLFNLGLLWSLYMLSSADENVNYEEWKSTFTYAVYYIPGALVLSRLTRKFNVLN